MSDITFPLTAMRFAVSWGDANNTANFSEVSGLTMEAEAIEYRGGADPAMTVQKIPGLKKYGNVTMKRGIVSGENGLFAWFAEVHAGVLHRRTVTVTLLNEAGEPAMVWHLSDAWPTKVEGASLNAKGNEIAIESVDIAHTAITVTLP